MNQDYELPSNGAPSSMTPGLKPAPDVVFSYRHAERERAEPLLRALERAGLRVWIDDSGLEPHSGITDSILRALSSSKALLAFYSATYGSSHACRWELTTAFLAGQASGDPTKRIIVANPEQGWEHVHPVELRDQLSPGIDLEDESACARFALIASERVATLGGSLGEILPVRGPSWFGANPVGSQRFVGRLVEIWQLHSALRAHEFPVVTGKHQRPVILRGLAGIGKTLLVEAYAMRFGPAYPGGVFWLRASDASRRDEDAADERTLELRRHSELQSIGASLGILDPSEVADVRIVEAVIRAKIESNDAPCLWIIDDFPAGVSAESFRAWLPPHSLAHALVTTQARDYDSMAEVVSLSELASEDGYCLLTGGLSPGTADEQDAARDVVKILGAPPLALDIARGSLALAPGPHAFRSFHEALGHTEVDELELAGELGGLLPTGHEKSISATLLRSIRGLDEAGLDYLRLAAVISSAPITADLLSKTLEAVDERSESDAKQQSLRAIDSTNRRGLSDPVEEDPPAHRVHVLVSRTISFLQGESQRCKALRDACIHALTKVLSCIIPARSRNALRFEGVHAHHLAGAAQTEAEADLLHHVADHLLAIGSLQSAEDAARRVVKVREKWFGVGQETTAAMSLLAEILHTRGDDENAEKVAQEVAVTCGVTLGACHLQTLAADSFLATTRAALGDLNGAVEIAERVFMASTNTHGEDHRSSVVAAQNLATHLQSTGNYARAIEFMTVVCEKIERIQWPSWEEDHAVALGNLGQVLRLSGNLQEANRVQSCALESARRVFGDNHRTTWTAINNMALVKSEIGDQAGARTLYQEIVDQSRQALGNTHPNTLKLLGNIANSKFEAGDVQGARELLVQVHEDSIRALGPEHPNTLIAAHNLAESCHQGGRTEYARELHQRTLEAMKTVLGDQHPHTITARSAWAGVLQSDGDLRESLELHRQVIESRRARFGDSLSTWNAENNYGHALATHGAFLEAYGVFSKVLRKRRRELGRTHIDTLNSENNLASALEKLGKLTSAHRHYANTLRLLASTVDPSHRYRLGAMANLASCMQSMGESKAALKIFQEIVEVSARAFGDDAHQTLLARVAQADHLIRTGAIIDARRTLEPILVMAQETSRAHDPLVMGAAWGLVRCLQEQGEIEDARSIAARHLAWLTHRDPESLSYKRREIRDHLIDSALVENLPRETRAGRQGGSESLDDTCR